MWSAQQADVASTPGQQLDEVITVGGRQLYTVMLHTADSYSQPNYMVPVVDIWPSYAWLAVTRGQQLYVG
jgi:hypothetical protein